MLMLAEEQWMEKIPMNSDAWTGHDDAIHCNSKQRSEYCWWVVSNKVSQTLQPFSGLFCIPI
jgi:hypothetical protein